MRQQTSSERPAPRGRSLHARLAGALSHDFCPRANRWVYWLKNPATAVVAAALAASAIGMLVKPDVLVVGGVLGGMVALGTLWPWLTIRGLRCELRFERSRCREGQSVRVVVRVSNRWPWPAVGLSLQKGFAIRPGDATEGLALARVAGWSHTEFEWSFAPRRRGVYPLEPCFVETAFPLGLRHAGRHVAAVGELIVWPRTVALHHLPDAAAVDSLDDLLSDHRAGDFGDLLGTRGFREGDSLRRMHWSQTARQGRLIVCERQAGAVATVRVHLDASLESHFGPQAVESLDTAVRIAASLCESLQRQHAAVECCIGRERVVVGADPNGLRRVMDLFARIPREGIAGAVLPVPAAIRGQEGLLQIVVTGAARSETFRKSRAVRVIAVGPDEDRSGQVWANVDPSALDELPARWRRACRAS